MQHTRVGLLVPELNLPGDAVGNDVAGMYKSLGRLGFECVVFTANPHAHGHIRSGTYQDARAWLRRGDLLIYQYASGGQEPLEIARDVPCPTIVRYHNVTPGHFFRGISAEHERTADEAESLLKEFLALPHCYALSASRFSNENLSTAGLPRQRTGVVPPFHVVDELLACAPLENGQGTPGCINLLAVGRIAPNKRVDLLLDSFAEVLARTNLPLHLTIIGERDPRLRPYHAMIDDIVGRRRLGCRVSFLEGLSTEELASCYRQADIFVTCSEHEGFCVPAIEAMAFGLPIVATSGSALPETCESTAILCNEPMDFVEAILALVAERKLRDQFGKRGLVRYREKFTNDLNARALKRNLRRVRHPFLARLESILSIA